MNVSRETAERIAIYEELLRKWSPKINLVSPSSLNEAARRHFDDSLQVAALAGEGVQKWVDLGSGGGFPGAVVAIQLAETQPDTQMILVESDQRKAAFLRTVSRETSVRFKVIAERIEAVESLSADVVSARALASLEKLLEYMSHHAAHKGRGIFLKGEGWRNEVREAEKTWRFTYEVHKSITNTDAAIIEVGDLNRA